MFQFFVIYCDEIFSIFFHFSIFSKCLNKTIIRLFLLNGLKLSCQYHYKLLKTIIGLFLWLARLEIIVFRNVDFLMLSIWFVIFLWNRFVTDETIYIIFAGIFVRYGEVMVRRKKGEEPIFIFQKLYFVTDETIKYYFFKYLFFL